MTLLVVEVLLDVLLVVTILFADVTVLLLQVMVMGTMLLLVDVLLTCVLGSLLLEVSLDVDVDCFTLLDLLHCGSGSGSVFIRSHALLESILTAHDGRAG